MRWSSSAGRVSGKVIVLGMLTPLASKTLRTCGFGPVKSGASRSLTLKVLAETPVVETKPSELRVEALQPVARDPQVEPAGAGQDRIRAVAVPAGSASGMVRVVSVTRVVWLTVAISPLSCKFVQAYTENRR